MKSLFFCLIKRTKIKAVGLFLKRDFSNFLLIFAPKRFILFTPEMLILSVIFCEASCKSLAFQFAIKTKQSQGQIDNYKLGFYELWMKFIYRDFGMICFELKFSPFTGKCLLFNWYISFTCGSSESTIEKIKRYKHGKSRFVPRIPGIGN